MTYIEAVMEVLKYLGIIIWGIFSIFCPLINLIDILSDEGDEIPHHTEWLIIGLVSLILCISYIVYATSQKG